MPTVIAPVAAAQIDTLVAFLNARAAAKGAYTFSAQAGRRFTRLVRAERNGSLSAYGFVDVTTGALHKSASWKAPAKNFARGSIHAAPEAIPCLGEYAIG
jgi:hypothetical protein